MPQMSPTPKHIIEIGEYYLVSNKQFDTRLVKIISITPKGHYYIEMDGVKKWLYNLWLF